MHAGSGGSAFLVVYQMNETPIVKGADRSRGLSCTRGLPPG